MITQIEKQSNFFIKNGYVVIKIFNKNDLLTIKKKILNKINNSNNLNHYNLNSLNLRNYHKMIDDKVHNQIINKSKRFINFDENLKKKIHTNKILSRIMKKYWGHNNYKIKWIGSLGDREIKDNAVGYRIARPLKRNKIKSDAAGAHCDLHVGGKVSNDKKIMITAWTPLVGFTKNYTLKIAPKTHFINHPLKKIDKNNKSVSRVLNNSYLKKFKFKRFDLSPGESIVFHPNLIHGGADNYGRFTRFSIEIRMFNSARVKKFPVSLDYRS